MNRIIQIIATLCLITLILMIFVGGTQPVAVNLFNPPWDKVIHIITFCVMFILFSIALPKTTLALLLIWVVTIGMLDEIHQIYLPGRSAGLDDLLADIVGSLIAYFTIKWLRKKCSL